MPKPSRTDNNKIVTLDKLAIRFIATEFIFPNSWNPNKVSKKRFKLLVKSIEEDGFTQPIICIPAERIGDYIIVDGEHRWKAMKKLGRKTIPVVVVQMSEEQAKISTIRHNKARGNLIKDLEDAIVQDLARIGEMDWIAESLLLTDKEINLLLEDLEMPPIEDREKALAEALEVHKKAGDLEIDYQYRVSLIFVGKEAEIVRSVLGVDPAENLLALCKEKSNG